MASIKILDPSKFFMTSDQHLCHQNIIKYCDRPFKSVEEMNEAIVARWNSVVPKDGKVLVTGDIGFHNKNRKIIRGLYERLNGEKYWALGNHDSSELIKELEDLFVKISHRISIRVKDDEVADGWQRIIGDHFPGLSWPYSHVGSWQAFGHHHGALDGKTFPDKEYEKMRGARKELLHPCQFDCGVDSHDFYPVSYLQAKINITKKCLKH